MLIGIRQGVQVIEALASVNLAGKIEVSFPQSTSHPSRLNPEKMDIIQTAFRSQETIRSGKENKSILCMPIVLQDEPRGCIYLENDFIPGGFAEERHPVLSMLASQALQWILHLPWQKHEMEKGEEQARSLRDRSDDLALTARELEVLDLIKDGLMNREIAEKLMVTTETVKVHVKHIFAKLEVSRRMQAVSVARERGIL